MVNIVVVGCGAVLEQLYCVHLREFEHRGWVRVCGVVDPAERRRALAVGWFKQARAFPDLESAFAALGKVDLTIVATPPVCHQAQVVRALGQGSHVLCEKPMAHSIAAGEQMVTAAREQNRILAVGMVRRFYPALACAKDFLRGQGWGSGLAFAYREGSPFDWAIASSAQFCRKTGGGGVLIDKGVHALDMLYYLFGPGQVLHSADDAVGGDAVEANAVVQLAFGAVTGFLQISWETPLNNGLHLVGPTGELWLPLAPIDAAWRRANGNISEWEKLEPQACWPADLAERRPKPGRPKSFSGCVRLELISVLRAILLGEPPMATGEDGLSVLRLLMAAYDQATPLRTPWLPLEEQRENASSHWRTVSAAEREVRFSSLAASAPNNGLPG